MKTLPNYLLSEYLFDHGKQINFDIASEELLKNKKKPSAILFVLATSRMDKKAL
jgi:hypothetical protein